MIVRAGSQAGLQDISPYVLGIGNKEHDALGERGAHAIVAVSTPL